MAKENKIKAIKILKPDGKMKYVPLYSIFDSCIVSGQILFEKKGMLSSSWKSVTCKLNLQDFTMSLTGQDVSEHISVARKIEIKKEKVVKEKVKVDGKEQDRYLYTYSL